MKDLKLILKNQSGVALMMIMTAIIILMGIYGEFTFESKISRIKATNILDKSQSKLLAESGVQMAMTRLRLYKEGYNMLIQNQNAKSMVPTQLLNQLWEVPFMFPIPVGQNAGAGLKETADAFAKDTLLEGEMKVTIQNISNRLNINMLRLDMTKLDPTSTDMHDHYSTLNTSDTAIFSDVSTEQTLFFLLKRLVMERSQKDEAFEDRNSGIDYQDLITNLKYFVSDYQSLNQDPRIGQAESTYQKIPLTPKFGPMASSSELYMIPGWNDELIELIQNEFSVYPSTQIDLNKLTANMLKLLIPTIGDEDIKEFFLYRDDPTNPKFFNSLDDFKRYIVDQERIISAGDFDNRMALFQKKGITFGSNPNLFKIVSEGTFNRSTYTIMAFVSIPTQPIQNPANPGGVPGATATTNPNGAVTTPANPNATTGTSTNPTGASPTNQTPQLLEPRIIEIQIF